MQTESKMPAESSTSATTHFTTTWGGLAIIVAGLLPLIQSLTFWAADGPLISPGLVSLVSSIALAVAAWLFAFGVRGEPGIIGDSHIGRVALVLLGLAGVALVALGLVTGIGPILVDLTIFLTVLIGVSAIIAAAAIARADVIRGPLRWGPAVVVAWFILWGILDYLPPSLVPFYLAFSVNGVFAVAFIVRCLLMIALGIGFALNGNAATLRRWRATVNRNG